MNSRMKAGVILAGAAIAASSIFGGIASAASGARRCASTTVAPKFYSKSLALPRPGKQRCYMNRSPKNCRKRRPKLLPRLTLKIKLSQNNSQNQISLIRPTASITSRPYPAHSSAAKLNWR